MRKGILLAGGNATRLYPSTRVVNKHLLPIYDKPMIYYSLSVLMLAGIREILIISTPRDTGRFMELLGVGTDNKYGLDLHYAVQKEPRGIAEGFIMADQFLDGDPVCMVLGDNIFFGHGFQQILVDAKNRSGATIFVNAVKDPERFGVATLDDQGIVTRIQEKPALPQSNWAITGLYFYDNDVIDLARTLEPSGRGELEISDINRHYMKQRTLRAEILGRGFAWLDTGTHESLLQASNFVAAIQERVGLSIASLSEIAVNKGFI